MLAIADKNGIVEASKPGLADLSRVSLEQCINALDRLSEPDEHSRSQDYEGRRIENVTGGWCLLNYEYYKNKMREEEDRHNNARRQAAYRARHKIKSNGKSNKVTECRSKVTRNAQSESESESDHKIDQKPAKYSASFDHFWKCYPIKKAKAAAYRAFKKAKGLPTGDELATILAKQKRSKAWTADNGQYIPHPATWLNGGCWEDEIVTAPENTAPDIRPAAYSEHREDWHDKPGATEEEKVAAMRAIKERIQ
jgi:hypothetical protein